MLSMLMFVHNVRLSVTYNLGDLDQRKDGLLDDPLDDPHKVFLVYSRAKFGRFSQKRHSFPSGRFHLIFYAQGLHFQVMASIQRYWRISVTQESTIQA